jgi:formamidopyrimidine-DNA glycosylase
MPELPEVETIRRQLSEVLVGKKILRIEVLREKSFGGNPKILGGWEIEKVGRKSKVIEMYFKGKARILIVHLKMTGQLVFVPEDERTQRIPTSPSRRQGYAGLRGAGKNSRTQDEKIYKRIVGGHPTADWVKDLPSKHTRVVVQFTDGSKLFFNDMRVFGWMRIITKTQRIKNSRTQAPDVVDRKFTLDYFGNTLKKSKKAVKLVLMDQEKIGGVGNIYANDALYLAKVMPNREANSLSIAETKKLWTAVKEVINKGIKYGGASAANYVDTKGMGGTYQDYFLVYKRDGQVCKKCGSKIVKMKIGGRGTFYCPKCQK